MMMKKVIYIVLIVIVNIILFLGGIFIFNVPTESISRLTVYNESVVFFLFVIILIGVAVFTLTSVSPGYKFRYFSVGLSIFIPSAFVYLLFFLNREFARKGNYESFELSGANWTDDKFFLNINFNMWANETEVTQEKCLKVDSVLVRVDHGLFGMQTYTKDVLIAEKANCIEFQPEENIKDSLLHFEAGHFYAIHRCFNKAISEYTLSMNFYPENPANYYHRGLMYMVKTNYKQALKDFETATLLRYKQLSNEEISDIKSFDGEKYEKTLNEAFENLSRNPSQSNFSEVFENMEKYQAIDDFDTYLKRMKFCAKKLKSTNI